MKQLQKVLFDFWNSFGVPAYLDGLAADPKKPNKPPPTPYITFTFSKYDFQTQGLIHARIWDKSTSFSRLWEIADKIEKAIPTTGAVLEVNGGGVILRRGTPWIQPQPMDDRSLRVYYINVIVTSYVL